MARHENRKSMKLFFLSLVFGFWSLAASGQIANTQLSESSYPLDTVKGAALVILDVSVENADGSQRTRFQGVFLPVYRIRQQSADVLVNDPTGQVRAYITRYFQRDWSALAKDDVALFLKRDWK